MGKQPFDKLRADGSFGSIGVPSAVKIERLRYMADQIARNFGAMAHDDAVAAVADHIAMFWDPRMKAAIFADDPGALSPIAAAAIARLAGGDVPAHQTRATEFNAVDETGHSDAG